MVGRILTVTIAAWIAVLPMLLLQPSVDSQTLWSERKTKPDYREATQQEVAPEAVSFTQIFVLRR